MLVRRQRIIIIISHAAMELSNDRTNKGGTSSTWTGSSGVRPDARQPDGSRSLSTGHIANRTENDNYSSRSRRKCLLRIINTRRVPVEREIINVYDVFEI